MEATDTFSPRTRFRAVLSGRIAERDPGFLVVVRALSRRGMRIAGTLGFLTIVVFVLGHMVMGKTLALGYGNASALVIWDKVAIALMGLAAIGLSWTDFGARYARSIVSALLVATVTASMVDDLLFGDVKFAAGWLSLGLLVALGTMPYSPLQFLALGLVMLGSFLFCTTGLPLLLGGSILLEWSFVVQLAIILVLCMVLVTVIYNGRFEQYLALERTRRLANTVAEQADELKRMEELKDRFFANISHEFRTSLTLVLGPVHDALQEVHGPLEGALRRSFQLMQRNGLRLLRLVNQLLDLSKLEAGHMHLHVTQHDVVAFVGYLVSSFRWLAERKHITLGFKAPEGPVHAPFDADKIEKAVSNLLSNALKFTPEHGKVQVSVGYAPGDTGEVEIAVRDTGPGIPPEHQEHVFDRFHQMEPADGRPGDGTGIGLALARELVELHRGRMTVESTPGFGSTFRVFLPTSPDVYRPDEFVSGAPARTSNGDSWSLDEDIEHTEGETPTNGEVPQADGLPTVAVIDDEADVREYLRQLLRPHYHVIEAADGVSGLELVRAERPDIVVSDLMMPRLDGISLCRSIKQDEHTAHIPVILLTARAAEESRLIGLQSGADDYLVKPFHAEMLLARVEGLIEIRRALRRKFSEEVVLKPTDVSVNSVDATFLQRVCGVIEEHMGDSNFGVEWLADEVGVSPRHLQRRMRSITRLSAKGFINMMRLKRAAQLLERKAGNVSEIAYQVGFQDAGYFSKLFKQNFGVTPSAFVGNHELA